jgi:hypothetical protein
MPTIAKRLIQIDLKVKRAKKHVADLDREIHVFLDTKPYRVAVKRDPQSRKVIYYVSSVELTPDCLPLIAGDVIQNLSTALDHLAYQIVCSDTGDKPPTPSRIYFPIADSPDEYESRKDGQIKGAAQESFNAINALKPYKGGNELLWSLYRLNNIEKHRLLITVGSMFQSVNLGAHLQSVMTQAIAADPNNPLHGIPVPTVDAFYKPADGLFPLKVGDELLIDLADAKVNENLQFRFNVALYEPQIIEAQAIIETLHQLTTLVEGIVAALTPRLRDTP